MAQQESILMLAGGLNQDDSLISPPLNRTPQGNANPFENGDYLYARNVRVGSSVENNTGGAELIPSTLLIDNYYAWNGSAFISSSPPAGNFTAIGKLEDRSEAKVYYCCYNSSSNHVILMFDKIERKIYEMLLWSGLNFDPQYPVQMAKNNKYVGLSDKNNPPRMFDATDIYKLKQTLGSNFSEFHLTLVKWAPLAPPVVTRVVAPTASDMKKGTWQFTYRYVYKGGFKSTFAPTSPFVTNEITEQDYNFNLYIPGFIFDYENPNNEAFNHSSVKFYRWVEYIELVYRESTIAPWKIFERYQVTSGANNTFTFSNNGAIAVIPASDYIQPFDSVPMKSGSIESIDNRWMLADNDDEFPAVDFEVANVSVFSVAVTSSINAWNYREDKFTSITSGERALLGRLFDVQKFSFKERGIYKLGIIFQHWSGRTNLVTSPNNWVYRIPGTPNGDNAVIYSLGFNIPDSVTPPEWAVAYQIVRTNCLNISYFIYGEINDYQFLKDDPNGITDNVSTPENVRDLINDYNDNLNLIEDRDKEELMLSKRIFQIIRKTQAASGVLSSGYIYIDIRNWYLPQNNASGNSLPANNLFYTFREGDRVRFWGSTSTSIQEGSLSQFDEEIIAFTGNAIIVSKPKNLVTLKKRTDTPNIDQFFRVEIYRETDFNTEDDAPFYEIGEWYPILNPGTEDRDFSKRDWRWDQASSVTASVVAGHTIYNLMPVSTGDVWIVSKQFWYKYINSAFDGTSPTNTWMQMNPDQDQGAKTPWHRNTGRILAAYRNLPTVENKPTQVRFSGKFLEDSIFININNFRDEWQIIYPSEYGRIRRLVNSNNAQVESVGNILIALGEDEPWSIYVNRATLEDVSGRTQVSVSDKVLGSYNTLLGSFGCINPESVSVEDGRVLWWSEKKGVWVRYARDGLTAISSRKMKNWFKDLSELIRNTYATSTPAKVISTFEEYHDRWITRIDHSSLPATFKGYSSYKCVTFSESDGRWKEFLDFAPDLFAAMDNEVYSIIGRTIQIHEEGVDFGKIYGSAVTPQIEVVSASAPRQNKDWKSVALIASDPWSFPSIKGDWRSDSATIQETEIPLTSLDKREDTYWADIKMDKNSPNAASEAIGMISGNPIKSKTLRLLLQLDPNVDYLSVFNWLIVSWNDSPRNPKN